jgi:predicted Fe-Mo cluster-binding NifX family protein
VARFLAEQRVEIVVAHHMGDPMVQMLDQMSLEVHLGASGNAGRAILAATSRRAN